MHLMCVEEVLQQTVPSKGVFENRSVLLPALAFAGSANESGIFLTNVKILLENKFKLKFNA